LSISFNQGNLPEGVSFTDNGDGTGRFVWDVEFDQAGQYAATFTLTDGDFELPSEVVFVINDFNRAPELVGELPDLEIDEDSGEVEVGDLDELFSDPDGDDLSFEVEVIDELRHDLSEDNVLTLNPADNYFGVSNVIIRVDDNRGAVRVVMAQVNAQGNHRVDVLRSGAANANFRNVNPEPLRDLGLEESFQVTVRPVNDEPWWVNYPQDALEADEAT
jgi:hypothetical protein